jgi:hypothetical protein
MGVDDANEGRADGECVEHVWRLTGMDLSEIGTHMEYQCGRCLAVMIEGPDELAGETP